MESGHMQSTTIAILTLTAVLVGIGAPAGAQDRTDLGKRQYEANCAVCHGTGGKGDGPYKEFLKVAPTDLTGLAKANNGVFPANRMVQVIDGREGKGHGPRDMPVWGFSFSPQAPEYRADIPKDPASEAEVRGRILLVVDYLSRIQQK
jgi:mono/diheme cytochrome c family protein